MDLPINGSGSWRLLYRLPSLLLLLLVGLPLTQLSCLLPGTAMKIHGRSLKEIIQFWWAVNICRVFGLRRCVCGALVDGAILIAANHISWLDIPLLRSIAPMGFVAKAEIAQWPLAGWLARFGDTVFHHRGSHGSASNVVEIMTRQLEDGRKIAIFAEGGILPGAVVKRFHARLFGAAIDSGKPVQPVMLRYLRAGRPYHAITFLQNEHFLHNFLRLLGQPACTAVVIILPAISPAGKQRRSLASEAQAAVATAFGSEPLQ